MCALSGYKQTEVISNTGLQQMHVQRSAKGFFVGGPNEREDFHLELGEESSTMAFRIPPNVKNYYEPITSLKSSNAMRCRICKGNNKDHIVERNDLGTKGLGSHLYYIHRKEFDKLWEAADKAKQSPSISSFVTQKRVGMSTQMDTLVAKFIINKNLCFSVVEDASFLAILEKAFPGQHSPEHTSVNIRQLVEGALYERGISVDSVVGLVRDDASNMRAFCRQAGIDSFQCVAHLLHLVVTGAFTADIAILEIIKNVRAVVSFLHRSHPAQVLLNEVLSSMNMRVRKSLWYGRIMFEL
uniref:Transposase n=1 Tax=Ditylenchus dipsaci TaxID=166011 RepID=A0A915E733_9BILA